MTAVADACADLARWLPAGEALIPVPDDDGTRTHRAQPRSVPPWNTAAADAALTASEGIRRVHGVLRYTVTGRPAPLAPHSATGATLESIVALSYAVDDRGREHVAAFLWRLVTPIRQLPAVDEEEVPQRLRAPCPRCSRCMLRWFPLRSKLACLGCVQVADVETGSTSGEAILTWSDGVIT